MAYYDISLNLSADTVRWVGSSPYELVERRRMARGDAANSSALSMSAHAGTQGIGNIHATGGCAPPDEMCPTRA